MVTSPQGLRSTSCGATKSLTAAVNESEERLLRYADANPLQSPLPTMPAPVRSIAASPNVRASSVRGAPGATGSDTEALLIDASKLPVSWWAELLSQHGSLFDASHW